MQPSRTYTEPLGRFSQLPRELQVEAWLRLSWKDRANICLSNNPPSLCFSESIWKQALIDYKPKAYHTEESIAIVAMLTMILDDIFSRTAIPGINKYYFIQLRGRENDPVFVKASNPREALWKLSSDTKDMAVYRDAILSYMWYIWNGRRSFSFNDLADSVVNYMSGTGPGYRLQQIRMLE